ncbi:MAG: nuclear transport factor 2 family protein [Actinomycetota bacterium]|nr:nuclear transport factor 2 family protein [Actinomycetota bacterium]
MTHPHEDLVRRYYAAREAGDRDGIRTVVADDVAWHDPYPPPHGGELQGLDNVFAQIFDAAGDITKEPPRFTLHAVLANDEHAAAIVEWTATMPEKGSMVGQEVGVFHFAAGKIREVWFFPEDHHAYREFFS